MKKKSQNFFKKLIDEVESYHNQDLAFFVMRLFLAVLFIPAGITKLVGLTNGSLLFDSSILTFFVGAFELVCGVMLLAGFYSKWAGLILTGIMVGAITFVHNPVLFANQFNEASIRLIILSATLCIFLCGSGKIAYKVD